ncbi:MAG: DNA polymerase III subunit chi [Kiloniellaceae bacterium]
MTEVRFYHLTRTTLERALPQMLEKTLERGQRAVVLAGSKERVEALNALLWTYNDRSFLPHGSAEDGHGEHQPIWLTDRDERPNGAEVLFLTDAAASARIGDYVRCAVLFDGNDPDAVAAARAQWSAFKEAGHEVSYWQQDEAGRWAQNG